MQRPLNNKPSPDQTRPHTHTPAQMWRESACLCYCLLLRTGLQMVNVSRRSRQRGLMGEASVLSLTATGRRVERDNMLVGDGGWEISAILPPVFSAVSLFVLFVLSENSWKYLSQLIFPLSLLPILQGIVHPKMKMMSSFTFTHFDTHLNNFLSCVEHKISYLEEWFNVQSNLPEVWKKKIQKFQIRNATENLSSGSKEFPTHI